jgi:hypothetical protein
MITEPVPVPPQDTPRPRRSHQSARALTWPPTCAPWARRMMIPEAAINATVIVQARWPWKAEGRQFDTVPDHWFSTAILSR